MPFRVTNMTVFDADNSIDSSWFLIQDYSKIKKTPLAHTGSAPEGTGF
jgi:hypothetical protein